MKGSEIIEKVMGRATKKVFHGEYEYSIRVIKTLLAMSPDSTQIDKNTIRVLGCMCCVAMEGGDYMNSNAVIEKMVELGFSRIGKDTMRNYRHKIKTAGWLVDRRLNSYLQKSIDDRGIGLGIFLGNGKGKQ